MKPVILLLMGLSFFSTNQAISAYDESVDRAPHFQVYQYDDKLKKIFGVKGSDSICWPSSLANRMMYLQEHHNPKLALHLGSSMEENVQHFVNSCRTNLKAGTSQEQKIPCILSFFKESGYAGFAQVIGKAATDFEFHRPVSVKDLREAIRQEYGVILHLAWLRFDAKKHRWIEKGSHSLNAYGFRYQNSWLSDRILLQVSNPGVDYAKRNANEMFDILELNKINGLSATSYPPLSSFIVSGNGFNKEGLRAVLEDIFIFHP